MQNHFGDIKASLVRLGWPRSRHSNPNPQRPQDDTDFFTDFRDNDFESGRRAVTMMSEIKETQDEAESLDELGADVHLDQSIDDGMGAKLAGRKSDLDPQAHKMDLANELFRNTMFEGEEANTLRAQRCCGMGAKG